MYYTDTNTDGIYAILPPKVLGQGANTYNSSEITADIAGTVVLIGSGAITVGFLDSSAENASFIPYDDGLLPGRSASVNAGRGARLAVSITGADGTSRVGYAGASQ